MDTAIYAAQRMALAVNAPPLNSGTPSSGFMPQHEPVEQPQAEEEQFVSIFFCRALYDYQSNDASSLSFHKNDIIEVLTRLETGWWDGLLGDERGWFPSNYVVVISEDEAEAALSSSTYDMPQSTLADDSVIDMGESMSRALSDSDRDGDWLERDAEFSVTNHRADTHNSVMGSNGRQHHDFWVPQVGSDGRIFYVNTQTGQRSQELPQEAEEDVDHELMPGTTPSGSRAGSNVTNEHIQEAGFGIHRRSGTPEPWVRRLADDGMSYYYYNTVDGTLSWTLPTANSPASPDDNAQRTLSRTITSPSNGNRQQPPPQSRMRSDSSASVANERGYNATDRLSVYSDDSDVQPLQRSRAESTASVVKPVNGVHRSEPIISTIPEQTTAIELTPAEQAARALQRSLSPGPAESPLEMSNNVCEAIATVVEYLQTSSPRRPEHSREVNHRVLAVVNAVRNLLYITATPLGHIPSHLYPRDGRSGVASQALQTHLKGAHRKVAGTLSKLVLSALAMQYDPALSATDKPNRMESDAAELERSVMAFMAELQRYQQEHGSRPSDIKRLHAVFSPTTIGTGLPGAGMAGHWRGFGYVTLPSGHSPTRQLLDAGAIVALNDTAGTIQTLLDSTRSSLQRPDHSQERVQSTVCFVLAYLSSFLAFVCDINVARHVDIDAVRAGSSRSPTHIQYMETVEKGRTLLRTLEAACQSLYDDSSFLLSSVQSLSFTRETSEELAQRVAKWEIATSVIGTNLGVVNRSLDALLALGLKQAELEQTTYNGAIEWRRSRPSVFFDPEAPDFAMYPDEEDVVDMELAFSRQGPRIVPLAEPQSSTVLYNSSPQDQSDTSLDVSDKSRSDGVGEPVTPTWSPHEASSTGTLVSSADADHDGELLDEEGPLFDDEGPSNAKVPPKVAKLYKILGDEAPQHYIDQVNADSQPWYLRPNYDQAEILIDPDGGVRAGSKSALIERLTAHETADPTFFKKFMITFKSFMTLDELFELLVQRFWIQPPDTLTPEELSDWTKQKQVTIRLRVINTFRTMVTDEDVLEREDMYILNKIKDFASQPEVSNSIAAAKQLVVLIDRVQRGGEGPIKTTATASNAPPPPILPKSTKKLKLMDIDPLELARQLTLMEGSMYKKIRPIECLQRSREQRGRNTDNIASIIQLSNRIANWVAESVLSREDSRKRAAVVKHFINVADRCRLLQNFSTMVAITSGLNTPPIRRLKRTWEQVNQRFTAQLSVCEATIDSNKNFNNYRSTLARITPPCVPFIGTYLTTLTFINDGAEDRVAGHMINFRKRQKAAEVIQDIKRWQAIPYNLQVVAQVLAFLEESFSKYQDGVDYGDQFWHLSLEREPREREDEKMARLLQESGFL